MSCQSFLRHPTRLNFTVKKNQISICVLVTLIFFNHSKSQDLYENGGVYTLILCAPTELSNKQAKWKLQSMLCHWQSSVQFIEKYNCLTYFSFYRFTFSVVLSNQLKNKQMSKYSFPPVPSTAFFLILYFWHPLIQSFHIK